MICGPAWVSACNLHQGPEALKGRADPRAPVRAPSQAALALRRAEDLRAMRLPGLRRALPARLTLLLFVARRRGEAFFFAVLAMVGSLFLFSLMIVLPNNESTILRRNRM